MSGVDSAEDAPPESAPVPKPSVNLSRIVLTRAEPEINLSKDKITDAVFKVNLNWNMGGTKKGFFGFGSSKAGDLDLAAYIRLKNGNQTIIQALGENFGSLNHPPYVELQGDDRSGSNASGEWIFINGKKINEIEEILIFTFIYEGIPNWGATDAVVKINIPGLPEVETRLNEGNSNLPMCAIARITNKGGSLQIEKLEQYFAGHEKMDRAYGWGFRWMEGSK